MRKETDIKELINRYLSGSCSEHEKALVESWYIALAKSKHERVSDELERDNFYHKYSNEEELSRIKNQILKSTLLKKQRRYSPRIILYRQVSAAAILLIIAGLFLLNITKAPKGTLARNERRQSSIDISPGGNIATLKSSNGYEVKLNNTQQGIKLGTSLIYADGNTLMTSDQLSKISWLELSTPRGGTYRIILPDGSEVWLNSASKLRYPVQFSSNLRKVELEGEAYFHVMPQYLDHSGLRKPFFVQTPRQLIKVLGTQFNINDYSNESAVTTTLVEGRVSVESNKVKFGNKNSVILSKSGDQSLLNQESFSITRANIKNFTGWRDGFIVLDHIDLDKLVRQIERWYNVDFEFIARPQKETVLSGTLPRSTNLSGILNALELNTGLKFEISGRRVIVKN